MTQIAKWFERKFEFSFPLDLYPNLMVRLAGTPPRLEELLRDRPRQLLTARLDDKWSAQEHTGHLLDLEPLWIARVEDYVAGAQQLSAADLANRKTDEANHNAHDLQEILRDFRRARMQFVSRVRELGRELLGRSIPHPRLKQPMRLVDHLLFVAEHDDHHLAKIWELVEIRR